MSFSKIIEYLKEKKASKEVQTNNVVLNNDYPDFQTYMEHIQELEPMPEKHLKTFAEVKKASRVASEISESDSNETFDVGSESSVIDEEGLSEIAPEDMSGGDIQETIN